MVEAEEEQVSEAGVEAVVFGAGGDLSAADGSSAAVELAAAALLRLTVQALAANGVGQYIVGSVLVVAAMP